MKKVVYGIDFNLREPLSQVSNECLRRQSSWEAIDPPKEVSKTTFAFERHFKEAIHKVHWTTAKGTLYQIASKRVEALYISEVPPYSGCGPISVPLGNSQVEVTHGQIFFPDTSRSLPQETIRFEKLGTGCCLTSVGRSRSHIVRTPRAKRLPEESCAIFINIASTLDNLDFLLITTLKISIVPWGSRFIREVPYRCLCCLAQD